MQERTRKRIRLKGIRKIVHALLRKLESRGILTAPGKYSGRRHFTYKGCDLFGVRR